MTDNNEDNEDIFSDSYKPQRSRSFSSIEDIEQSLVSGRKERWQKNTRKRTKEKPEAKVKSKIKAHLESVYNAKIIRTNAGSITDQFGNTIYLGETGQSDLHAIIPIELDGFLFGIFAAIEIKANEGKKPEYQRAYVYHGKTTGLTLKERIHLDQQKEYIGYVKKRGGIGFFAWSTEDVDKAIIEKMLGIQLRFESRKGST